MDHDHHDNQIQSIDRFGAFRGSLIFQSHRIVSTPQARVMGKKKKMCSWHVAAEWLSVTRDGSTSAYRIFGRMNLHNFSHITSYNIL